MDIIVVLLLLMPGLIAMYIDQIITGSFNKGGSDYEWVFNALIFNIPSFTITWIVLWAVNWILTFLNLTSPWNIVSLTVLVGKLKSLKFVVLYLMISVFVGVCCGYFIALQRNRDTLTFRFLNWLRKRQDKSDLLGAPSAWDKLFNNRNEPVVEIIRGDGTSVKGFVRDFYQSDGTKELTIDSFDVVDKWHEYLGKVVSVYYHLDSDTLIKIYDTSEYLAALEVIGQ